MSPFNFHQPQSRVFSPCMHFTGYFSWISGPGFQPLWAISTVIFSYPLTPRTSSLSTASFTRTALQVTLGISANLSWTHSQTHHKAWDPEISSRTSLFWTLPEQLSKLQRALPQICPKPMSQEKNTRKTSDPKISSHTSLFWTLPEQLSKLQRAFPQICPKPMSQEKTHKTSDPKISSHTSLFWTLPEQLSKLHRGLSALNIMPAGIKHNNSFLQSHPLWPKKTKG